VLVAYKIGHSGAVQDRARREIEIFVAAGVNVTVVTDDAGQYTPPRGARLVQADVPSFVSRVPGAPGEVLATVSVGTALRRALRNARPTVVVFHSSTLAWPALRAARRSGARSVFVAHALIWDKSGTSRNPYGPLRTALYLRANRRALDATTTVCVSQYLREMALANGAAREVTVVPNTVDLEAITAGADDRDIDALYVGRLSHEKGPDVFATAMERLPRTYRAVVVGDGPMRSRLETYAADHGLAIDFRGHLEHAQVYALMRRASVLVAPSRSEAQGVAIVEALASGTPVIASAVGGIPEVLSEGENGWLVPPDDPGALAATMLRALGDDLALHRMRVAARTSAAPYSATAMPDAVVGTYLTRPDRRGR
jgi:colanic acid/amylovoran biosynthesis glycosyltransferase